MTKPALSVCIPVYNRPDLVRRALESCLAQTQKDIEIVVVDDASKDNTFEIIKSYAERDSRVKAFRNEKNLGMVPNWARTFELATGDYVQHLGSDDMLSPDFAERKLEIFKKYPEAAFVGCGIRTHLQNPDGGIAPLNETKYPAGHYTTEYLLGNFYRKPTIISTACTVRREDMLKNFDLTIPNKWGYEDIYKKGGKIMDNLVFLKILTKYKFMYLLDDVFYESVEHPRNSTKMFFGLERGNISDHIKFNHMDEVGLSYFYKNYAPAHLSRYRIFIGSNTLAGTFFDLALGRAKGSPLNALRDFFSEYTFKEKTFSYLEFPLFLVRRFYEWILRKMNLSPIVRLK
jgi:glycosyltransferase involved in cell wall biosynthesis